jgi:hypothetical protein
MAPRFEELGYPLPPFRVAVGFPSAGLKSKAIGECWDKSVSRDDRFEIFLRPDKDDSTDVAAILAHELIHAAVGLKEGHKGKFATVALGLGFQRPLNVYKGAPDALVEWLAPMLAEAGPMPHASLQFRQGAERGAGGMGRKGGEGEGDGDGEPESSGPKKQTSRLLKACCQAEGCGYTVRVTSKWVDQVGAPHCPLHGAMHVDGFEPKEPESDD